MTSGGHPNAVLRDTLKAELLRRSGFEAFAKAELLRRSGFEAFAKADGRFTYVYYRFFSFRDRRA